MTHSHLFDGISTLELIRAESKTDCYELSLFFTGQVVVVLVISKTTDSIVLSGSTQAQMQLK